jgi:hypothetical protein
MRKMLFFQHCFNLLSILKFVAADLLKSNETAQPACMLCVFKIFWLKGGKNPNMQFLTTFVITVTLLFFSACKPPGKVNANIVPFKDSLRMRSAPAVIVTDSVKQYDSLQIEFGEKLGISYDSIYNLTLYRYIKDNLDKKCSGSKREDFTCESFLPVLFKNVYTLELPLTIAGQMQFNGLELYKDTSYLHEGDLLFFSYSDKQKDRVSHNGFYLWNGYFLAATFSKGIIITSLGKSFWSSRFVAAGRIKKQKVKTNP